MKKLTLVLLASAAAATSLAQTTQVGALRVVDPWTRAMPAPREVTGVFMTLENTGLADDVLVGGSSTAATRVEVHSSATGPDGVMRMRHMEQGLTIPANGSVRLQHGGYHIMLFGLREPSREGATLPLTLRFRKAGEVTLQVPVKPVAYMPPAATATGDGGQGKH
ncbi:MAG: hypothetical protein RL026_2485 [Pseudomonadota bacterium]|jgi:copper(I)-binding protein